MCELNPGKLCPLGIIRFYLTFLSKFTYSHIHKLFTYSYSVTTYLHYVMFFMLCTFWEFLFRKRKGSIYKVEWNAKTLKLNISCLDCSCLPRCSEWFASVTPYSFVLNLLLLFIVAYIIITLYNTLYNIAYHINLTSLACNL